MRLVILSLALAAALPAVPAAAQGLAVYAGAGLFFKNSSDFKGTNNDFNAYVEGEIAHVYGGISGDIYNSANSDVLDLYLGYRSSTASGVSYDVSYDRSIYPNAGGDCCGELNLNLGVPTGDKITTTLDANYDPGAKTSDAHLSLDYALTDKITLTGKVGVVQNAGASDTKEWELAAAYQLGDKTAVTVHYYDGSDYKPYLGLDLTFDTTILGGASQ